MNFANFWYLYVVVAALVAALLLRAVRRRNSFAHSLVHLPVFAELQPTHLRLLPAIFRGLAVLAVGVALMDPRVNSREGYTRFEGLDVILVLDLSSSMLEALGGWEEYRKAYEAWAKDRSFSERSGAAGVPMPETRMAAVRDAMGAFVSQRKEDRIALIAFSESTYIISPLTIDHAYLAKYISMLDGDILIGEGVTAMGDAIHVAMGMFRKEGDAETRNKVIVVFTDGEYNFGRDPVEVLSEARYYGYRVYLIGVDLGEEVKRKPKVQELIRSVELSGGRYFDARDKNRLEEAYRAVDRLEKGIFAQRIIERDVPVYQWFAGIACLLLLGAAVLEALPYFIDIS